MYSKRSLVGVSQEMIDKMFRSFDLDKIPNHTLIDSKNIQDKWLLSWMISQPEVKIIKLRLQPNITTNHKELIVKDIQSGIVPACIKNQALVEQVEKFLLKALTLNSINLSPEQRSLLNIKILPELRKEKGVWSSESIIEIICTLFSIDLVFESQYFDEIIARTLTVSEKLNAEHETKIARLNALMLDQELVLQFGTGEDPFKNASFLYNRASERVFKDSQYIGQPYRAKTLKAIYDADIVESKLENYEQLAKRYEKLSKISVENAIIELNNIAKELGIEDLISRTNERMPKENFPYLNPNLYCKTIKSIKIARKQQIKGCIK